MTVPPAEPVPPGLTPAEFRSLRRSWKKDMRRMAAIKAAKIAAAGPFKVTPGNVAWAMLEGYAIPQAAKDEMAAADAAMCARTEANQNCRHEYARVKRGKAAELHTRACVKCGHVKIMKGYEAPTWMTRTTK